MAPIPTSPTPVSVGRIVHYVLPTREHRAAMVVAVDGDGVPNLSVFLDMVDIRLGGVGALSEHEDQVNDVRCDADRVGLMLPRESVPYSEDHVPGSWHWPERVL